MNVLVFFFCMINDEIFSIRSENAANPEKLKIDGLNSSQSLCKSISKDGAGLSEQRWI